MKKIEKDQKIDPKVGAVLKMLGTGTILLAALVMPGPMYVIGEGYKSYKREKDIKEWKKFNLWRLRQMIKRLEEQKAVEIEDGVVKITEKGKRKLLKFDLDEMKLNERTDGKWRIIIYDISELKKRDRDMFRSVLKSLKFYKLQESVYLTPFVCEEEIEYLRQVFHIGGDVQVLKVTGIDNEKYYKEYFGI